MKILSGLPYRLHLLLQGGAMFLLIILAGPGLRAQSTGPTPFPESNNEGAWPGTGPVGTRYPYMTDNRNAFWAHRQEMQGAVVFFGDSLLGNWAHAKVTTAQSFPQIKLVANRGIGGDTSRGMLFRFQEDVLDLNPEAIVMCAGSNDLSARGKLEDAISNIKAMLEAAQKANPAMPIIICNLPPREDPKSPIDPAQLTQFNQDLAQLVQGKEHVILVDLYSLFATPEGKPDPAKYRADMIHPNEDGYAKVTVALNKIFEQLKLQ